MDAQALNLWLTQDNEAEVPRGQRDRHKARETFIRMTLRQMEMREADTLAGAILGSLCKRVKPEWNCPAPGSWRTPEQLATMDEKIIQLHIRLYDEESMAAVRWALAQDVSGDQAFQAFARQLHDLQAINTAQPIYIPLRSI